MKTNYALLLLLALAAIAYLDPLQYVLRDVEGETISVEATQEPHSARSFTIDDGKGPATEDGISVTGNATFGISLGTETAQNPQEQDSWQTAAAQAAAQAEEAKKKPAATKGDGDKKDK